MERVLERTIYTKEYIYLCNLEAGQHGEVKNGVERTLPLEPVCVKIKPE